MPEFDHDKCANEGHHPRSGWCFEVANRKNGWHCGPCCSGRRSDGTIAPRIAEVRP